MFRALAQRIRSLATKRRKKSAHDENRPRCRPLVEALEDRILMKVFLPDDRIAVSKTTSFPWAAVARIEVTFPNGKKTAGTGALVSEKHVLTAAHVIYNSSRGGWATSVVVSPGQNGSSKPFGTASKTKLRTWKGWTQSKNYDYDMALITLNKSIGFSTGWFGLKANGVSAGKSVNTAGYPGDLGSTKMYRAFGPISHISGQRAYYKGALDTADGQSGSPVWVYSSSAGTRQIVAVHSGNTTTYNYGTILNTTKFNSIIGWMKQDGVNVNASSTRSVARMAAAATSESRAAYSFDFGAAQSSWRRQTHGRTAMTAAMDRVHSAAALDDAHSANQYGLFRL